MPQVCLFCIGVAQEPSKGFTFMKLLPGVGQTRTGRHDFLFLSTFSAGCWSARLFLMSDFPSLNSTIAERLQAHRPRIGV